MASTHPRILRGLAAGRGDGVRPLARLQFAGLGQAWLGQTGRGPERPVWVVHTREKAWPRSGPVCPPPALYARNRFLASSVFPPAAASEDRREAEPRATHGPGPARLWGRRGEQGRGRPGTCSRSSRRPGAQLLRPSPRPGALAPTLTRGAGTMAAAAAATQRGLRPSVPSPLPSLATPLHSGKRSPPRALFWYRCARRKLPFPTSYAPRPRHGSQRGR